MNETQYYVDQNGKQYYLDQNGQPVYIDPIQPARPASVPQQDYVEQPFQQQPALAPQAQPALGEPALQGNFAPPEDYGVSVNAGVPVSEAAPVADQGMYAEQYGAAPVAAKSKLPVIFALVGSIGLGGVAAYVYNTQFTNNTVSSGGSVPFIKATSTTAKVKPENSGGKVFQNTNKLIYDRSGGEDRPQNETLRTRAEKPEVSTMAKAASVRENAQKHVRTTKNVIGAPKSVKTFVVLPDGRVIRPGSKNVPAKAVTAQPKTVKKVVQVAAVRPVGDRRLFVNNNASIGTKLRGSAPQRVEQRPTSSNGKFKYKPRRIASNTPMAAPAATPKSSPMGISSGDFLLQLAARRSHDGAMQAFSKLKQQYVSILGSYTSDIQKADLGAKGIYYRVRVGPINSRSAAMDVCQQLKDAGGDCLIRQK